MPILLLGRWNHAGNLLVEETHQVQDGDQDAIDSLVASQDDTDCMAWACEFDVDRHSDAVQQAYEEYVRDGEGNKLIDQAQGFEPQTH